jgi:hypothetical protein
MADRESSPTQHRTFAANAAFLVLAALFAVPALAATGNRIPCNESIEATLNVAVDALITETVSHNVPQPVIVKESSIDAVSAISSTNLLAPRAEEAIREAFKEVDSATHYSSDTDLSDAVLTPPTAGAESKAETVETEDNEVVSGMNTKLPGVSDDAMSRYKKQMFRRDI